MTPPPVAPAAHPPRDRLLSPQPLHLVTFDTHRDRLHGEGVRLLQANTA